MLISDIFLALGFAVVIFFVGALVGYIGKTHINRRKSGWYEGKI